MAGDFGTQFLPQMAISHYDGQWSQEKMVASDSLTLHPGAHVLHYASTCFEGLKAGCACIALYSSDTYGYRACHR